MSLFHIKKNEIKAPACNCAAQPQVTASGSGADSRPAAAKVSNGGGQSQPGSLSIKILGTGCAKCHEQLKNAEEALKAMGLETKVEYITDLQTIMTYGVMSMPAVVINEKVVAMGKVLKPADLEKLLKKIL
ncbi:MAG: thioredoxin family protein [Negativicutes bacterium]|nr:thioredoxin family protein [Negativicutes bacterium]